MYVPCSVRFGHLPDFEVTYKLFSAEEGGRRTPAYQGIRWDFMYEEYPNGLWIIHPEFSDVATTNEPHEPGIPIPEYGKATMWIVNPQLRSLYRERIKPGTRGFYMEGTNKMGVCEVTQIVDLFSNPTTR